MRAHVHVHETDVDGDRARYRVRTESVCSAGNVHRSEVKFRIGRFLERREMRSSSVSLLLLASLLAAHCRQYTLNVPRVLLPLVPASGVKANFTLKSQAGCFAW